MQPRVTSVKKRKTAFRTRRDLETVQSRVVEEREPGLTQERLVVAKTKTLVMKRRNETTHVFED